MAELYPGFVSLAWFGVVAPPKMPAPIAQKRAGAIVEAIKLPEVARRLSDLCAQPMALGPEPRPRS